MQGRIKGLDGLRGIAVIFVIISHSVLWPYLGIDSAKVMSIMNGHIGVSIFFVLSGYLITILLIKERDMTGTVDIVAFMKRRALRIFPLYYLAIFFLMCMDLTGKASIPNCSYPYALTYTINFISRECEHSTLSHFWSLSVEEHFYIFWPAIFLLGKRFSIIILAVLIFACFYIGSDIYGDIAGRHTNRWTFPAILPILAGCLTAMIHRHKSIVSIFNDKSKANTLLLAILAGFVSPAFTASDAIWIVSMCALLVYVYNQQDSIVVKLLEFKPLAMIGVISYGLYVWQGVFTGNGPYRSGGTFPPPLYTGLWITFIVAPISYVFFERPLLKIKDRFSWRTKQSSPQVERA